MDKTTRATDNNTLLRQDELDAIEVASVEEAFAQDKDLLQLVPNTFVRVDSWHRIAVRLALGAADNQVDAELFALIWAYTTSPTGDGVCYASAKSIAPRLGYEVKTIRRSLARLMEAKLIKKIKPTKCTSVKTLVAMTNHPAVIKALAWENGEYEDMQASCLQKDERRRKIYELGEQLQELSLSEDDGIIDKLFDAVIGSIVAPDGSISTSALKRVLSVGEGIVEKMSQVEATVDDVDPLVAKQELPPAEKSDDDADVGWAYEDDYNTLADLAAEHTTNSISNPATKAAYEALRADFSAAELIDAYKALEVAKKGTPDDKWPSLHSFLTGERSCRGRLSARRLAQESRERSLREAAAAEAAEADRAEREREARQSAEYDRVLTRLAADDQEYQQMHAELMELLLEVKPGDAGSEVRQLLDELTPLHDARFESLKAEARRRCGMDPA